MKNINILKVLLLSTVCIFILTAAKNYSHDSKDYHTIASFSDTVKQAAWLAPASADSLKNPLPITQESISKGEELYNMYCFSCHGDTGYGDGPAGGSGISPANFHDKKVIKQKDGALFWKLTNGKGNMPPFKEALTIEQRWQLIVFLRELGKTE